MPVRLRFLFRLVVLAFAWGLPGSDAAEVPLDFSTVGWRAGHGSPPNVPAALLVVPTGDDDTARLQAALDALGSRPVQPDGFRGAVQLIAGTYRVTGTLRFRHDGVVLRGWPGGATVIVADGVRRTPLVRVGLPNPPATGSAIPVSGDHVDAGSTVLPLGSVTGFQPGERVLVHRPSTAAWIEALGMHDWPGHFADQRLEWTPGSRDLQWHRIVTAIDPAARTLTLDAPITTALEARFGGGMVAPVTGPGPVRHVGLEDLTLVSAFDPSRPHDEEHAWNAIELDFTEDVWVRRVTARHFVSALVRAGPHARRVTVADCRSEAPVSEIGGYRREAFLILGQQVLVHDCVAVDAVNAFATGHAAAGPNVFFRCVATSALGPVGPAESWTSGVLYEDVVVDGHELHLGRRSHRTQGAGWTAANSVVWNSRADAIRLEAPPGAVNLQRQEPGSLLAQQRARRGLPAFDRAIPPPAPDAPVLSAPLFAGPLPPPTNDAGPAEPPLRIVNGRFVVGGRTLWGGAVNAAWWRGQATPAAPNSGVSITRFVPGRYGPGLTEDLAAVAARMRADGTPFYQSGPGLWYDRRRDDHLTAARPDADVWAPFYEMPWARSGIGRAQDGLSRFDLTQYNPWYFQRIHDFATECRRHGLVLYNNLHNTHNLLETLAHWVDYPWRPANHVNVTGLPEPPPLDPGNTVHLADRVYNVDDPVRRGLHRAYIRQHLRTLAGQPNVIHSVAFQFAGPLAFQQFFLDTVAEWERETGEDVKVALVTSRDISEAILADPIRGGLVDVIDLRYWQTLADGTVWAPRGDRNLAFREMNAEQFGRGVDTPPDSTPLLVYRQVREYRERFPRRAIVAWHGGAGPVPVLMAGGAQALMRNPAAGQGQVTVDRTPLDGFVREQLAEELMRLDPRDGWFEDPERVWCLADDAARTVLASRLADAPIRLGAVEGAAGRRYRVSWFDPGSGEYRETGDTIRWSAGAGLASPFPGPALVLLRATE